MRRDKHEPEAEPIISDAAARFTMALFLALFTIGAALFIWRGLSPIPEGDHWIDQVMEAIRAFSTFAAMLLIVYLVFATKAFSERKEGQSRLRYQHGLAEGWKQGAQRFGQEATPTCGSPGPSGRSWLKPPPWRAGQSLSLHPGRETPGVDATTSLLTLNSKAAQEHLRERGRRESPGCGTTDRPSL